MCQQANNQKADPFSRIRPQSVDDLLLFLLLSGFFLVLVPHCASPKPVISVVQTESFEYSGWSEA